jgi:hypothetical protein
MSTVTTHDWDAGERRERRLEALLGLAVLMVLVGWPLVRLDLDSRSDRGWLIGMAVVGLVATALWIGSLRWRGRKGAFRVRHAIREHVDPGPHLRDETDVYAERAATGRWFVWLQVLIWLPQVVQGRWEDPGVAVPGAVLLGAGLLGVLVWHRRLAVASRRWLDDPPGPSRDPRYSPPPERPWTVTGRQAVLLLVLVSLVGSALTAAYLALV